MLQELADDHPAVTQFRYLLATSHYDLAILLSPRTRSDIATLLSDTSRSAEAEAEFRHAMAILRKLAGDNPAVTQFRLSLMNSHRSLGQLLGAMDKPKAAEAEYRQALQIAQRLADEHPDRFYDRKTLAVIHQNLGVFLSDSDRLEEGESYLKQAIGVYEQLVAQHPDLAEFAMALALSYGQMSYIRRRRGDQQGVSEWMTRETRTLETILRRAPDYVPARQRLPYHLFYSTNASARLGRQAEAIADCDRAIKLLDGEERDRVRLLRALALAHSGDYARAAVEADALAKAMSIPGGEPSYDFACVDALLSAAVRNDPNLEPAERAKRSEQLAARSVHQLERTRIAGFFLDPGQVKRLVGDTDLAPLRSRPDFQLLNMDAAFPADVFARGD
jgi:eukaryotic-like serine/threonine-protein kinase